MKEMAKQVIDRLPEQATWDDILYNLYVKQRIEVGLTATAEGKTAVYEDAKRCLLDG